jgi:glycosyltransferase involved in cell wall biosynthesis
MRDRPFRVAYLVTHPIQYQAPLLRKIAAHDCIDLKVFFQSDVSLKTFHDPGFGRSIQWDTPLTDGYDYEFLPSIGPSRAISKWAPYSYGLRARLRRGQFDALWVHGYGRPYNLAAIGGALAAGVKVLIRDEATAISKARNSKGEQAKALLMRGLSGAGVRFLAIGSLNRDYLRQLGVPNERIFDMPYCVDNDYFQRKAADAAPQGQSLRASLDLREGVPVILYASKFQARKRPDDLLQAYRQLASRFTPDRLPYLLYIGDGEMRAELERTIAEHGLDRVRILGFRNQSELPGYFNLCDVFVLPSVHEPWGLVVNEVMNASKAVITTNEVGCAPDLVRDGENGFAVPVGDVPALAQALFDVVGDADTSARMGRASKQIIDTWNFDRDVAGLVAALEATVPRR